jgi:hypothetical protein
MVSMLVVLCDACFAEGRRIEAQSSMLGVDGSWRTVHLCTDCAEAFSAKPFAEVVDFYREHGEADKDMVPVNPEEFPCLWCDRTLNFSTSLVAHMKSTHRLVVGDDPWGHVCPLCGGRHDRLAMHVGRVHGMHISQAMLKAENEGDKYRAVIAARKRA